MTASLRQDFWDFHKANPQVYKKFEQFAFDVIKTGRKRYSAKAIVERMRWHSDIESNSSSDFKFQNNHTAYYARLFMYVNPMHEGFFKLREVKENEQTEDNTLVTECDSRDYRPKRLGEIQSENQRWQGLHYGIRTHGSFP